jgi:hypothetical protein
MGTEVIDAMTDDELVQAAIEAAEIALSYEMTEGRAYREQTKERSKWQGRRAVLYKALKARGIPIPPMKNTGL